MLVKDRICLGHMVRYECQDRRDEVRYWGIVGMCGSND